MLEALKPAFLDTAHHYSALGKHGGQYASLLTFAALDLDGTFTTTDLAGATRALPPKGLHGVAQTLVRMLEGAGDQRNDYWSNRVKPYLHTIWPKTRDNISPSIAESLGRLCIAAQGSFPDALSMLRPWLQPPASPDYLVHMLHKAGICERFPGEALEFLSLVIGSHSQWPPNDLSACLNKIKTAAPELETDWRFEQLRVYLLQRGRS